MIDEVIIRDKQFYDSFGVLFKEGESFAYNQEGEEKICDILRIYTLEYSNVINAENSSIWASSVCRAKQGRCLFYIQLGYSEETDFPSWVYSCKTDYDCESHLGDIAEKYTLNTSGIISKGCILS
jgi:hypothetical protein